MHNVMNGHSQSRIILRANVVSDRDFAAIWKRGMKPTRTSAEDAACSRGLKKFSTEP